MSQYGPNMRRLLAARMSRLAIPDGGGFVDGLAFFFDKDKRRQVIIDAENWVTAAIFIVRTAPEPNPWREADSEAIAGEILRRVDERHK